MSTLSFMHRPILERTSIPNRHDRAQIRAERAATTRKERNCQYQKYRTIG